MKRKIQRLGAIILSIALLCGLVGCAGNQKGTDGKSAYELAVKNGYDGTELEWLASLAGEVGADGESAYELAVKNGYRGTEAEWLNSLIGASGKDGIDGEKGEKGDKGATGAKGDTGAQGEKGDKGDTGATGAEGKSAYKIAVENGFQGSVEQWLDSLKGEAGVEGQSAYKIAVGNGYRGTQAQWLESLRGEAGTDGASGKSAYEIAVENGYRGTQTQWLTSLVGANGKSAYELACESGFDGDLAAWLDSLAGEDGVDGINGANGKSAYELAVENGFDGSVTEWLASLVGADGDKGDQGEKGDTGAQGEKGDTGATGADGKSAYEIARENGYLGTQQEWLASLVGASGEAGVNGKSAYEIAVGLGYQGSEEEWLSTLAGKNGLSAYEIAVKNGFTGDEAAWLASLKGEKGDKGDTGVQGVGIVDAYVNDDLHLILVLTNGTEIDSGYVGLEIDNIHTVTFKDWNGTVLKVEQVESGKAATAPANPSREGYIFSGWSTSFEAVTSDLVVVAAYTADTTQPVIYAQSQLVAKGTNEVTMNICVRNNPGIMGAVLKVSVDDNVFGFKEVQKTGFPGLSLTPSGSGNTSSPYTFMLDAMELTEADRGDGTLFTITFTIKDTNAAGAFDVNLSYEDGAIFDEYYSTPAVVMEKGTITIE